jgi:hypothetical protein
MLWATGAITIEAVNASRYSNGRAIAFRPTLNRSTGKLSTSAVAFNEANWGGATHGYAKLARKLTPQHFIEIMKIAISFSDSGAMKTSDHQQDHTD